MIFQLLWFMDLCLYSNSVFGHLIASVTYKNSNQQYIHMAHVSFHIPKDYLHFFPLSPPSSLPFLFLLSVLPSLVGFLFAAFFFILPSHFWLSSSLSSSLFFFVLLSLLPPVPFMSYTTRLVSLPKYLEFKCPPQLLLSLLPLEQLHFTHWWWGFKPENLVSHGWKWHPRELVVYGGRVLQLLSML